MKRKEPPHSVCAMHSMHSITDLPTDVLSLIFTFIPLRDNFGHVQRVCRHFYTIARRPASYPSALTLVARDERFRLLTDASVMYAAHLPKLTRPFFITTFSSHGTITPEVYQGLNPSRLQSFKQVRNLDYSQDSRSMEDMSQFFLRAASSLQHITILHTYNLALNAALASTMFADTKSSCVLESFTCVKSLLSIQDWKKLPSTLKSLHLCNMRLNSADTLHLCGLLLLRTQTPLESLQLSFASIHQDEFDQLTSAMRGIPNITLTMYRNATWHDEVLTPEMLLRWSAHDRQHLQTLTLINMQYTPELLEHLLQPVLALRALYLHGSERLPISAETIRAAMDMSTRNITPLCIAQKPTSTHLFMCNGSESGL